MAEFITGAAPVSLGAMSTQRAERLGLPFVLILIYLIMEYARPANPMRIPMLISIVLFLSWAALPKKNWSPQMVLFFLLLFVIGLMGPFATNSYSVWMGFRNMSIQLLCISLPVMHFVSSIRKVSIYVNTSILVYVYVAIYGILHGGMGPGGIIGDENDLNLALNVFIPFAFVSIFIAKTLVHKMVFMGSFILMVISAIMTHSRGGFLGLIPVLLYCFSMLPNKRKAILIGAMLGLSVVMFAPESYWDMMATIPADARNTEQGTGAIRREHWAIARRMFADHPFLGVGIDNYMWNIPQYQSEEQYERLGRGLAGYAAHSLYFTVLAELGMAGLIIFGAVVWFNIRDARWVIDAVKRQRRNRSNALPAGVPLGRDIDKAEYYVHAIRAGFLGFLISGTFLSVFTYAHFWLLTGFTVALKSVVRKKIDEAGGSQADVR